MSKLEELYLKTTGERPDRVEPIAASGSSRRYYRIFSPAGSLIGCEGDDKAENRAFSALSAHFREKGLNVPRVVGMSNDGTCYLQEDLGETSLFDILQASRRDDGGFSQEAENLLVKAVRALPDMQWRGAEGLDFNTCYPASEMNHRMVDWDLSYFKYCFLKPSGYEPDEEALQDDFDRLADELLAEESNTFMIRDFQSRNVMIKDDEPWFIDFQGGRRGPVYYDLASFLRQARAAIPLDLQNRLIDEYLDSASRYKAFDRETFMVSYRRFALFRQLQTLGAYGFRGLIQKKSHFIKSIAPAMKSVARMLETGAVDNYPELRRGLEAAIRAFQLPKKSTGRLKVTVMSFSYHKGIPQDMSGNGGGFVFDCRAIHNPGRYEPYKKLTGRDLPVIEFLEEDGEITEFLEHVYALVDASVKRYLSRGFDSLMVCFGCTGGQHRSVYCAEHTASHIKELFPVDVELIHREHPSEQ